MKRLYRSRKDKIIAGVCGGIGEYTGIDPVIIRIIAVVLFFWGGSGLLAYIIGMIIIPVEPYKEETQAAKATKTTPVKESKEISRRSDDRGALIIGLILVFLGGIFLMRNLPVFDDFYWWIRHQIGHLFWPLVLIFIGSFIIFKGVKKN